MAPAPITSQRCRQHGGDHGLLVGPDRLTVGFEPRQHPRPRPGGKDDVGGAHGLGHPAFLGHVKRAGACEPGVALDHRDPVLLHQVRDAAGELVCNPARIGDDLLDIDRDLAHADSEIAEPAERVAELRDPEQRLGGDAPPVEADAAEAFPLDHGGLEAELARADRCDIAARAGADDDDVKGRIRHGVLRSRMREGPARPAPAREAW